jgi:CheY-like chemotaxis protein
MTATWNILWADDEIDMLRPHILFLEEHGYHIRSVANGADAVANIRRESFDLVLLDEQMPGQDGLTTLVEIKKEAPSIPVIMITKSEEEGLMDDAIGRKIDDFLTKPVNPSQILSACKKILEGKKIREHQISRDYVSEITAFSARLMQPMDYDDWIDLYLQLMEWERELEGHSDASLLQILQDQWSECNKAFSRYIEKEYPNWVQDDDGPCLSTKAFSQYVMPELKEGKKVWLFVLDCLRYDQWFELERALTEDFSIERNSYYSILPTATPYARNALFSGMFPGEMEKLYPDLWQKGEDDDFSRNRQEHALCDALLEKEKLKLNDETRYIKILDSEESKFTLRKLDSYLKYPLVSVVVNFVDILAHKRGEVGVLKEMMPNESAYRSLVASWFDHSTLLQILRRLADEDCVVFITTDHGSIRAQRPSKVVGDKQTSTGLRYKFGRNLKCDKKHTIKIKNPSDYKLPCRSVTVEYVIAKDDFYLIFPTNYNKYVGLFRDSFQHGGISMEEMILPFVRLEGKRS